MTKNGKVWRIISGMKSVEGTTGLNMKNNKLWKIIGVLAVLFIAAATVIYARGGKDKEIEANTKAIEKHEVKIDKLEDAVTEQTTHYEHIKEALDDIKKKL